MPGRRRAVSVASSHCHESQVRLGVKLLKEAKSFHFVPVRHASTCLWCQTRSTKPKAKSLLTVTVPAPGRPAPPLRPRPACEITSFHLCPRSIGRDLLFLPKRVPFKPGQCFRTSLRRHLNGLIDNLIIGKKYGIVKMKCPQ
eukprot:300072-Rhodomonas_salina.2